MMEDPDCLLFARDNDDVSVEECLAEMLNVLADEIVQPACLNDESASAIRV